MAETRYAIAHTYAGTSCNHIALVAPLFPVHPVLSWPLPRGVMLLLCVGDVICSRSDLQLGETPVPIFQKALHIWEPYLEMRFRFNWLIWSQSHFVCRLANNTT